MSDLGEYNKFDGILNLVPKLELDLRDAFRTAQISHDESFNTKKFVMKTITGWTATPLHKELLFLVMDIAKINKYEEIEFNKYKEIELNKCKEIEFNKYKEIEAYKIKNFHRKILYNIHFKEKNRVLLAFLQVSDDYFENDIPGMVMEIHSESNQESLYEKRDKLKRMILQYRKENLQRLCGDPLHGVLSKIDSEYSDRKPIFAQGQEGVHYWNIALTEPGYKKKIESSKIDVKRYSSFLPKLMLYRETDELLRTKVLSQKSQEIEYNYYAQIEQHRDELSESTYAQSKSPEISAFKGSGFGGPDDQVKEAIEKLKTSEIKFIKSKNWKALEDLAQYNKIIMRRYAVSIVRDVQLSPLLNKVMQFIREGNVVEQSELERKINGMWNEKNPRHIDDHGFELAIKPYRDVLSDLEPYWTFSKEYWRRKEIQEPFIMPEIDEKLLRRKPFQNPGGDQARQQQARQQNEELLHKIGGLAPDINLCYSFIEEFEQALTKVRSAIINTHLSQYELFKGVLIHRYARVPNS